MATARIGIEFVTGKAAAATRRLKASVELVKTAVDKLNNRAKIFARETRRQIDGVRQKFQSLQQKIKDTGVSVSKLQKGLLAIGGTLALRGIIETGVTAIESERKIKLLTRASGDTAEALAIAARSAEKFGLSQTDANVGVARLLARLKPMGLSLSDIESTFNGFNTAARLAGATASESSGAFLQLTQALGSGVLRGQELNSILEQAPLVAQAIAKELNVTVGALKKLGEEGEITAPTVIAALKRVEKEGAGLLEEALKGPGQQFRNLRNAGIDLSESVTQKLLPAILPLVQGTTALVKAFLGLPEPVKAIIVGTTALTVAAVALAPALTLATKAAVALKLALIAFPFVAAAAGLVAVGVAVAGAQKEIKRFNDVVAITGDTTEELDKEAKEVRKEIDDLAVALKRGGREGLIAKRKLDTLNEALDKIEARKDLVIKLKIDVPFPNFAEMGPGFKEELEKEMRKLGLIEETPEEKKARERLQKRIAEQQVASKGRLLTAKGELAIANETSDLARIDLEFDLERGKLQREFNRLKSRALSNEERTNLQKTLTTKLEALSVERNKAISGHMQDQFDALSKVTTEMQEMAPFTKELSEEFKSLANTINNEILSGIEGMIDGTKTLGQVASSMLKKIASQMLQTAIMGPSGSGGIAGSIFRALGFGSSPLEGFAPDIKTSGIKFFANGGRPPVGRPSVVGERGPELFIPDRAGTIIPNHAMGGATVNVAVDASGSSVEGNADQAAQLGKAIGVAVQQELIKQKRPGGLLAS